MCALHLLRPLCSPRGDLLDTRLLRAMVLKGILEQVRCARCGWVTLVIRLILNSGQFGAVVLWVGA